MAEVIFKSNPFEEKETKIFIEKETIEKCISEFIKIRKDLAYHFLKGKFKITVNDVIQEDLKTKVKKEDIIFITPSPEGAGFATFAFKMVLSSVISFGLHNLFSQKAKVFDSSTVSPSYGYDKAPIMVEGDCIPLHFGRTQAVPSVISAYLDNVSTQETKNLFQGDNSFSFSNQTATGWENTFTITKSASISDKIRGIKLNLTQVVLDRELPTNIEFGDDDGTSLVEYNGGG